MKILLQKILNSRFSLAVVSIFFSIILFLTAAANNYSRVGTQISGATETYTHTLTDVPIDIKYDSDKYYVSGYSYEAQVYLTSTNRVKLDSEINSDTRSFKVVADLSKAEIGTGTVTAKLKVTNLPSGLTATVSPKTISITIGKKKTETFSVEGKVNASQLADGYELKSVSTNLSEVEVTSDEATIDQIDHVVASLPDDTVLDSDYSDKVTLQAVSTDGTILPSVIKPAKSELKVEVKKITKTIPVSLKVVGDMSESLSNIDYKLSNQTVTISGSQEAVAAVNEVVAEVDITNVTKNTSKTVSLSADNVTIEPNVVTVQLTVKKK